MIFPEIKIIEEIESNKYYTKLLKCRLDWSGVDSHKKKHTINWCNSFLTENLSNDEKDVLNDILSEEVNWDEFNYPTKWKHIYDKFEYINIPKPYYEELKHLKELAISEWNRSRPFDTNVREHLLSTSIKSIELFFYLLSDALLYNGDLYNGELVHEGRSLINVLWLFRFWKHQTGDGLVVIRSTSPFSKDAFTDDFIKSLDENMNYKIINGLSLQSLSRSSELKDIIKQRLRDKKISSILPI